MNGGMSPAARELLRAAKADSPGPSTRADMWKGIEQTVAGTAATAGTGATANGAGAGAGGAIAQYGAGVTGSAKAAFVGALVGSAASLGVVAIVLHFSAATLLPTPERSAIDRAPLGVAGERFDPPSAMMPLLPTGEPADDLEVSRAGDAPTTAHATVTLGPREREDILTREAALVTSARHQLLAGNAEGALHDVRAARALPVRQLEPEVLTLEARALRALGRDDEAVEAEMTQRLRFPSRRF